MKQDSRLQLLLQQMLQQTVLQGKGIDANRGKVIKAKNNSKGNDDVSGCVHRNTADKPKTQTDRSANKLKSPSDLTLYAPALNKEITPTKFHDIDPYKQTVIVTSNNMGDRNKEINRINEFIDQMRIVSDEGSRDEHFDDLTPGTSE